MLDGRDPRRGGGIRLYADEDAGTPENLEEEFWPIIRALLDNLLLQERGALSKAAALIADRMATGGQVFVYDTGHMLERELIHRAGGLVAWAPFSFRLDLNTALIHEAPQTPPDPSDEVLGAFVGYALEASGMTSGDVLLLASVTGSRPVPVELALQAQARAVPVIGLTSPTFANAVPARHPSGRRVLDVADVVIRNDGVVGDAAVSVPGVPHAVAPTSGITAAVLAWSLVERVTRLLTARGNPPAVVESMNLPGAPDRNRARAELFRREREKRGG